MANTKTNRKFCFISGLPRSGSTLLCNIIAQNPRFHCNGMTSGIVDLLNSTRESWERIGRAQEWEDHDDARKRILRAMFYAYFEDSNEPVVFDKSRRWPSQIEMLEMILGTKAKIIVTVRDMRAIMSSWEKLWRKNKDSAPSNIPIEFVHSVEGRVKHWGSPKETTGWSYLGIQDAIQRGFEDRMLFVDFDRLTRSPEEQMKRIYSFIEEDHYKHNFNDIKQENIEKDPLAWMKDLHVIRQKLEPVEPDWLKILGPQAEGLADSNKLWLDRV